MKNLEDACQHVLNATRTRYNSRGAQVGFKTTYTNNEGVQGIAIGSGSIYEVRISPDYFPHPMKDNGFEGCGEISCTCADFKKMNPSGTPVFKLDPCKHLMALAHKFVHRGEADKGEAKLAEKAKPTHVEVPTPTWVEAETNKGILATISGIKRWWPKSAVVLRDTATYVAIWLATQEGVAGKEICLKSQ